MDLDLRSLSDYPKLQFTFYPPDSSAQDFLLLWTLNRRPNPTGTDLQLDLPFPTLRILWARPQQAVRQVEWRGCTGWFRKSPSLAYDLLRFSYCRFRAQPGLFSFYTKDLWANPSTCWLYSSVSQRRCFLWAGVPRREHVQNHFARLLGEKPFRCLIKSTISTKPHYDFHAVVKKS